jgi:lipoate-protein ligase B
MAAIINNVYINVIWQRNINGENNENNGVIINNQYQKIISIIINVNINNMWQ